MIVITPLVRLVGLTERLVPKLPSSRSQSPSTSILHAESSTERTRRQTSSGGSHDNRVRIRSSYLPAQTLIDGMPSLESADNEAGLRGAFGTSVDEFQGAGVPIFPFSTSFRLNPPRRHFSKSHTASPFSLHCIPVPPAHPQHYFSLL